MARLFEEETEVTAIKMTMVQAINTALRDAMTADDSVVVFGEDVGAPLAACSGSPTV
jgi:hypothetical protein